MGSFKNVLLNPEKLRFTQKLTNIVQIPFCFKSWSPGVGGEPKWGKLFLHVFTLEKILKDLLRTSSELQSNFIQIILA
jgi:hypothetical protein